MTMQDNENPAPAAPKRVPWNEGKLVGAKPPLRPKPVWSIRTKLQIAGRVRDLAMFNLAIDEQTRQAVDERGHRETSSGEAEPEGPPFSLSRKGRDFTRELRAPA
jgi:hypothetical protein